MDAVVTRDAIIACNQTFMELLRFARAGQVPDAWLGIHPILADTLTLMDQAMAKTLSSVGRPVAVVSKYALHLLDESGGSVTEMHSESLLNATHAEADAQLLRDRMGTFNRRTLACIQKALREGVEGVWFGADEAQIQRLTALTVSEIEGLVDSGVALTVISPYAGHYLAAIQREKTEETGYRGIVALHRLLGQ